MFSQLFFCPRGRGGGYPSLWCTGPRSFLGYPSLNVQVLSSEGTLVLSLVRQGEEGGYPSQDWGTPLASTGVTLPPDRRVSDATPQAVRLLRSRRRTFLSMINVTA